MPAQPARPLTSVPDDRPTSLFRLVKETPPEPGSRGRKKLSEKVAPMLNQVKDDPGEWYRLATYTNGSSGSSAAGTLRKQVTDKKWTFLGRKTADGSALYACYGTPKADA